jgi:hypothetical protein
MFFKKHGKKKKNKGKKFTCTTYKSSSISKAQMLAISESVISKRRLFVFAESI